VSDNPYEAPAARVDDEPALPDDEAVRRTFLRHEARLQSVAWLYWLAGGFWVMAGLAPLGEVLDETPEPLFLLVMLAYWAIGAGFIYVGRGYQDLRPWVRIPGSIVSGLGLLAIPFGTLINAYIFFLMFGTKGQRVFAPDYAGIRARTPHIAFRRSVREKVAMVLVVVVPIVVLAWYFGR
jgi:hypothetical protein